MLIARNRQTSLAPLHLLASVVATVPHPAENCGSIENPRSPLTDDHRVLLCHAIAHASDHTFARICLAHATGGRSCKHCPNEGIREAACAMSNPCAQHSSRLPAASVESGEVAHHGAALGFTDRRPVPIQRRSSSWDSVVPATDAGVFRCSHRPCEVRVPESRPSHVALPACFNALANVSG